MKLGSRDKWYRTIGWLLAEAVICATVGGVVALVIPELHFAESTAATFAARTTLRVIRVG